MIATLRLLPLICAAFLAFSCEEKEGTELPPPAMPEVPEPNKPTEEGTGVEISVMSFNVRYPASSDTDEKAWSYRLTGVKAMLDKKQPDIIGVQECYASQRKDMLDHLKGYSYYGVSRTSGEDSPTAKHETTSILYNTSKFEVLDKGTFWLSETPNTPSAGWDATIKRSTTWILFKEKTTERKFYVVNTHLDHQGIQAQTEGVKLIRTKLDEMNKSKLPVVVTGDMNVEQNNTILQAFKMENLRKTAPVTDTKVTCHGYGGKNQRIDHIFYEVFIPKKFETVVGPWAGMTYISDHNPVMGVLEL